MCLVAIKTVMQYLLVPQASWLHGEKCRRFKSQSVMPGMIRNLMIDVAVSCSEGKEGIAPD